MRWYLRFVTACALVMVACKGEPEPAPPEPSSNEQPAPTQPAPPASPPPETKPAEPNQPESTTPKEPEKPEDIDLARKQAMLEGRDADVIKYCEMQGVTDGKSDPQVLLGCALAACRINQADKARA